MRADRLLSLLLLLQSRGRMTASELAEKLEVSERTIYRDISALGSSGVPVYSERGPGGGCRLVDGYHATLNGLTEEEARTLLISSAQGPASDLGMTGPFEMAALKLIASLPARYRERVLHARQRIHVDPVSWSPYDEPVPYLAKLQQAVLDDERLCLLYRKGNGDVVERIIDPLGLVAKTTIWYLVARYTDPDGQLRVFRVSRVLDVGWRGRAGERPLDFDLAAYWQRWSAEFSASLPQYHVSVRIEQSAVSDVISIFGNAMAERIALAERDGTGAALVTLTYDSAADAQSRLLPICTLLEVMEPLELRERLVAHAARVIASYTSIGSAGPLCPAESHDSVKVN